VFSLKKPLFVVFLSFCANLWQNLGGLVAFYVKIGQKMGGFCAFSAKNTKISAKIFGS